MALSANLNHLWFHKTQVLEALRVEGSIPSAIGYDLSAAVIYRPKFTQNLSSACPGRCLRKVRGSRTVRQFRWRQTLHFRPLQCDPDLLI
jgi:hypothetical protein